MGKEGDRRKEWTITCKKGKVEEEEGGSSYLVARGQWNDVSHHEREDRDHLHTLASQHLQGNTSAKQEQNRTAVHGADVKSSVPISLCLHSLASQRLQEVRSAIA